VSILVVDVGTRAERAARAGDHEEPSIGIGLGARVGVAQFVDHRSRQCVEPVGPVERDRGDAIGYVVADALVVHRASLPRLPDR